MVSFLIENDLLSNYQFRFIKGRSTILQLLNVLIITNCIYIDYQKAFDKVPHCRLISKLKACHFHGTVIDWVEAYLRDRSQYVEVNGKESNRLPVTSRITQGSVLRPLL